MMPVLQRLYLNIKLSHFHHIHALRKSNIFQCHFHRQIISRMKRCSSQFHTSATLLASLHKTVSGSKYHPPTPYELMEWKMVDELNGKEELEPEEWDDFKSEFYLKSFNLNDSNFDSITMNVLLSVDNIHLANSFMKYLKKTSVKPNMVTNMKYMLLCSKHMDVCQQNTILQTYENIRPLIEHLPALDATSLNCIVQGLCVTDQWRKSFDYLKKLPLSKVMNETKSGVATAAFRNDDEELGWMILTTWLNMLGKINSNMLSEYVKLARRVYNKDSVKGDTLMNKFLKYLHFKNVIIKQSVAEDIVKYFQSHKSRWIIKKSGVDNHGVCETCKQQLKTSELSHNDFETLRKQFLEKALHKYDVFINTTEKEFRQFMKFVDHFKPFDAVVDGLNIAYSTEDFDSRKSKAIQLLQVIKKLSLTAEHILIVGRHHMKNWPRTIMNSVQDNAKIFFTSDMTQEDTFLIYAALASGPNCLIVSSDLMRDHISRLDGPQLIHLYNQWQQSHQVYVSSSNQKLTFMGPLKHSICVQGNMNTGWHIPYDDEFVLEPYEVLNNWLCIQRNI